MSALARRYAKALFELAKESGTLETVATELDKATGAISDPAVGSVLGSPLLESSRLQELLGGILRDLAVSDLLSRFLRVLGDHGRLSQIAGIAESYHRQLDSELGRVRVHIRTAAPLTEQQQADIVGRFGQITGKKVLPQVTVEPSLLGGVLVEVGGKVYDGSIRNQLERLAARLSGPAMH